MPSRSPSVCVVCRTSFKGGSGCGHEKIYMSHKWRAPKKDNDKAWKMIEAGDIWWDKKAVENARLDDNIYTERWRQRKVWLERLRNPKYGKGLTGKP